MAVLLVYLFMVSFLSSPIHSEREYSTEAWIHAAKYLQQSMDKKSKPCEQFYEHVCGNYVNDFETTLAGKASAVASILSLALKNIDLESTDTPEYEKAVKVFYDKCTSVQMDSRWPQRLYDALAKRIGELPLFIQVRDQGSSTSKAIIGNSLNPKSINGNSSTSKSINGNSSNPKSINGNGHRSKMAFMDTNFGTVVTIRPSMMTRAPKRKISTSEMHSNINISTSSSTGNSNSTTTKVNITSAKQEKPPISSSTGTQIVNTTSIPITTKLPISTTSSQKFTDPDPWFLLGKIEREIGESVLVQHQITYIEDGCHMKAILHIKPVMVPDELANASEITTNVLKLMDKLGLDRKLVEPLLDTWLNKTLLLRQEWANLSTGSGSESVDIPEMIPMANLSKEIPGVNWKEYLRGLLPEDVRESLEASPDTEIIVENKDILRDIGESMKRHGVDVVKSLIYLQVMYSVRNEYFGEMDAEDLQLVQGRTAHERCLEYALRFQAPAMARIYFNAIGADILLWRHEIQMLARNIFSAFRFLLNSVDWLDLEDKQKIQEKVDSIVFNPGIPSWIGNEEKIMERILVYNTSLDPFENEFLTAQKAFDDDIAKLVPGNAVLNADDAEPDPSFQVNAEYDPSSKQINMFLGLMVPPLFNVSYPLPVKYGGLGVIIGHELMHAFDVEGIYAGVSDDQTWLKTDAFREFERKKNCLVHQYSKYCERDKGLCVNGERTIGENIADIDGLKVAYTAYKIVTQVIGDDPPIPGMIQYTDDQIFFMSFARTWCSKGFLKAVDLLDEHTPGKPRVEVALRNVPMFGRAFQCAMGSKYVPMSRGCSLWGDLSDSMSLRRLR